MALLSDVIAIARVPLNDRDADDTLRRFTDADLLKILINGLLYLFRQRSDLYLGQLLSPPSMSMTVASTFPLTDDWIQILADWIVFRAEMTDDENVNGGRAQAFSAFFGKFAP
jgi:hypothetical protein